MSTPRSNLDLVRAFVDAFNAEDTGALLALCHPDVEVQTRRGVLIGHDEVRHWASRSPHGYLHQRLALDSMREDERRRHVVAFARREWSWKDRDNVEEREDLAILVTISDGLIARWHPFEESEDALAAAGIDG